MKKPFLNAPGQPGPENKNRLKTWYQGLEAGQRRALQWGGGLIGLFLGLNWGVLPAWQVLQAAPQAQAQAEAQWVAAQSLATQAQTLRAANLNALTYSSAQEILQQTTQAQLKEKATFLAEAGVSGSQFSPHSQQSQQGGAVAVQISEVPPATLVAWLEQVRLRASAQVVEAQLNSGPQGWAGKVVFRLPIGPV